MITRSSEVAELSHTEPFDELLMNPDHTRGMSSFHNVPLIACRLKTLTRVNTLHVSWMHTNTTADMQMSLLFK